MSERISTSSPRSGSISDDDPILAFGLAEALKDLSVNGDWPARASTARDD